MKRKEKDKATKRASSTNMVRCENDLLACEDEDNYEVKVCKFLREGRICGVKVGTDPSSSSRGFYIFPSKNSG